MAKYNHGAVYIVKTALILVILTALGMSGHAYSQESVCAGCVQIPPEEIGLYKELFPLTIWTDSAVYDHDAMVHLSGHLKPQNAVHPVTITVSNPVGNIVAIEQLSPGPDGSFGVVFHTSSPLWGENGFYIIRAQSGVDSRLFKTEIELVPYDAGDVASCNPAELPVHAENGGVYCVGYSTSGETTGVDARLSIDKKTLSLDVRSTNTGDITLSIPRYVLDSQTVEGEDADFGVYLNGKQAGFSEDSGSEDFRTITVSYPPDRLNRIDIVGTTAVPEFGMLASLIMVVGVSTAVLFGMRSRLKR